MQICEGQYGRLLSCISFLDCMFTFNIIKSKKKPIKKLEKDDEARELIAEPGPFSSKDLIDQIY